MKLTVANPSLDDDLIFCELSETFEGISSEIYKHNSNYKDVAL